MRCDKCRQCAADSLQQAAVVAVLSDTNCHCLLYFNISSSSCSLQLNECFLFFCSWQNCQKPRNEAGNSGGSCTPSALSLCRAAREITLWEFLRLKVRGDSDRPNSTPRLAQMIAEFDALQQQLRSMVKDQLVPVSTEAGNIQPASKILVVSSNSFCTRETV